MWYMGSNRDDCYRGRCYPNRRMHPYRQEQNRMIMPFGWGLQIGPCPYPNCGSIRNQQNPPPPNHPRFYEDTGYMSRGPSSNFGNFG